MEKFISIFIETFNQLSPYLMVGFLIAGFLSVVLTGALATYMANYIQKHIWIAYVGLILILIVGLQLIIGGLVDLEILKINEEFIKYF